MAYSTDEIKTFIHGILALLAEMREMAKAMAVAEKEKKAGLPDGVLSSPISDGLPLSSPSFISDRVAAPLRSTHLDQGSAADFAASSLLLPSLPPWAAPPGTTMTQQQPSSIVGSLLR